jgi:hypothetical protein
MWMYPMPSCPDRSFYEELGDKEINTRVHGILTHGVIPNFGTSPVPLRERVNSPYVSLLGPTFGYICQFWFLNVCMLLRRVSSVFVAPRGVTLLEDVVRQEANRVHSEQL